MSEDHYNLRSRAKAYLRSRSETKPFPGYEPFILTSRVEASTVPTGEKGPPGPQSCCFRVAPLPGSEMGSRPVFLLIPGNMDSTPARDRVLSLAHQDQDSVLAHGEAGETAPGDVISLPNVRREVLLKLQVLMLVLFQLYTVVVLLATL